MILEDVKKQVKFIQIAFSINKTQDELIMTSQLYLHRLKAHNVTKEEFEHAVMQFIDTQDENFKQFPTIARLLKLCNKDVRSVEELAREQCQLVWQGGYTYAEKLMFDNATTNYVIDSCFGGLSNFRWNYLNSTNENKVPDQWGQKSFIEHWITAYKRGSEKTTPLFADHTTPESQIVMIGDKSKIGLMLEHKSSNNEVDRIVKALSTGMKG